MQEHILGNDTDGAHPQEVEVGEAARHPAYSGRTYSNDIAVVKLSRPALFNSHVQPLCLPSLAPSLLNTTSEGNAMFIAGWGAVRFNGPTSKTLLQGLVTVISEEECKWKLARFRNIKIGRSKLCARDLADKVDACQGDSGGPLMTKRIASDGIGWTKACIHLSPIVLHCSSFHADSHNLDCHDGHRNFHIYF